MFVASMAFFAKVSDPAVGGTYMTLLNTLCNLGGNWPATAALWFVDTLTFRQCSTDYTNDCSTITEREVCLIKFISLYFSSILVLSFYYNPLYIYIFIYFISYIIKIRQVRR